MKVLKVLLFPFSVLFDVVTSIRNRLYDTGVRPSAVFEIPLVSVGNLAVGGTGKTPMVEYLIRLFSNQYKVATLSRGYGRRSKGIMIAGANDGPRTIGDEPFQLYRKFKDKVVVAVGEERALAIPYILQEYPDINLILLDDAFQHRRVRPSFQILLTDYNNLFFRDFILPAGRLRESKRGASRADVVVVTKCPPNITEDEMLSIESSIRHYSDKAVFFSRICYDNIQPGDSSLYRADNVYRPDKIMLVSGIASPAPLVQYLEKNFSLVKRFLFPDHHVYSKKDLESICEAAVKENASVVTTEKDIAKMDPLVFRQFSVSLYYLPIKIEFLKNGKEFEEVVLNAVRTYVL